MKDLIQELEALPLHEGMINAREMYAILDRHAEEKFGDEGLREGLQQLHEWAYNQIGGGLVTAEAIDQCKLFQKKIMAILSRHPTPKEAPAPFKLELRRECPYCKDVRPAPVKESPALPPQRSLTPEEAAGISKMVIADFRPAPVKEAPAELAKIWGEIYQRLLNGAVSYKELEAIRRVMDEIFSRYHPAPVKEAPEGLYEALDDLYRKSLYNHEIALKVVGAFDVKDLLDRYRPAPSRPEIVCPACDFEGEAAAGGGCPSCGRSDKGEQHYLHSTPKEAPICENCHPRPGRCAICGREIAGGAK